jgi:hypothetical protein
MSCLQKMYMYISECNERLWVIYSVGNDCGKAGVIQGNIKFTKNSL